MYMYRRMAIYQMILPIIRTQEPRLECTPRLHLKNWGHDMVSKRERNLVLGVTALAGLTLFGTWYVLSSKKNGGNGNGNGNGPPPLDCDIEYPYGSVEWCRCNYEQYGEDSYVLNDLKLTTCPMIFSLIPQVPNYPKNPEQYIIIETRDRCGQPKPNVDIWLSQSTTEWGGFVVPGYKNVNCAHSGEILIGRTNSSGQLKIRYLCHHNPGKGVAETIYVYVKAWADNVITNSCMLTINGTDGMWPFDPNMNTQEFTAGSGWTWYDCNLPHL